MSNNFLISADKTKLDKDFIVNYLSKTSYWASGRKEKRILNSIDNSFCFGVYLDGKQIGFARIVTDFSVFAWIMDLFITPTQQGKGFGKKLMNEITTCKELKEVTRWGLNTKDAHKLYESYGFKIVEDPNVHMEMLKKQT